MKIGAFIIAAHVLLLFFGGGVGCYYRKIYRDHKGILLVITPTPIFLSDTGFPET